MTPRSRAILLLALTLAACGGGSNDSIAIQPAKSTHFAVFSDPHLYDTSKLGSSSELDTLLLQDHKMIKDSAEILDAIIGDLNATSLDFVLVPGDLTKDGELVNHELMAQKLALLEASGKKVYVIPGNNDIYNPDAKSYLTMPASAVANIGTADFSRIYRNFGYGEAVYQDSNSLSYIVEPVPGLWLFAIDSCKYAAGTTSATSSGAIRAATQNWILTRLQEARRLGKQVIGMMHHGIAEHYPGQTTVSPGYVLDEYATVGKLLADNGLNVIFTGHYHANDVVRRDFTSSVLHDIETGSTVTAPNPYRIIAWDIAGKTLSVSTRTVQHTASQANFPAYATGYITPRMTALAQSLLVTQYGLDTTSAANFAPAFAQTFIAHYAGDEQLTDPATITTLNTMTASGNATIRNLGLALTSIWTDLAPADNTVTIQP